MAVKPPPPGVSFRDSYLDKLTKDELEEEQPDYDLDCGDPTTLDNNSVDGGTP